MDDNNTTLSTNDMLQQMVQDDPNASPSSPSINDMLFDLANQAEDEAIQQQAFTQKYEELLEQIEREDDDFNGTATE